MNPAPCLETARKTLREHAMLEPGEKVLVAVSGGPDSVCLFHVLHELGHPLELAHLDHGTRHGESAADAEFVRQLAARYDVPVHVEHQPIEEEASTSDLSFEDYARRARYAFLVRTAKAQDLRVVATGHHADDQIETMLIRLLRGTTPRGLAGIPPVRHESGIRIVRPLITCTRADILAYLEANNHDFRTDTSNADPRFLRNKVRHNLLPQLHKDYNPKLAEALLRLAEVQRAENDLLSTQAESFLAESLRPDGSLDRKAFAAAHVALQRRAVLLLALRHEVACPFDIIDGARQFIIDGSTGRAFDLGAGVLLRNTRDTTEVVLPAPPLDEASIPLTIPGETMAFGKRLRVRLLSDPPPATLSEYCTPTRQVFDADVIGSDIAVRRRQPGDRFTPLGMAGSKKLKDYFIDIGMPRGQRDTQLLITAGDRIAWVIGHAISAHVAVTAHTSRILQVEVEDAT